MLISITDKRIKNYEQLRQPSEPKLLLSLGSSGQLVLYLFTYEKKEFRTFLLKIDRQLLEAVWSSSFLS
jgi:hypothetical protein